ncbi:Electron transport complex protein RnfB [hydrothermal vent metagenome]|uniref:Electron transport complex protein RnfB n=1 Tax=hydrothermal vent metagenome TaxID=652676 RepID=A0A3B0UXE2_9ZZZZ
MFDQSFIVSVLAMGGLGVAFAACLAIASVKFRVEEDPVVERVLECLPGTNCGACGYAGCHALAEKMVSKDAAVNACPAGGQEVADMVAKALGVEMVAAKREVAVVLCRGGDAESVKSVSYRGDRTCASAVITGGEKDCSYSCLGYGDCVKACCFDSMGMNANGLPEVFFDRCVGCGACARACPRDVIEMHPEDRTLFVYCRNRDKGAQAKKACKVACIGCSLCKKDCEVEGGINIDSFLAVIDYELCPQDDTPTKRCPTKCILNGENVKMTSAAFIALSAGKAQND